jgi:calpain-15
VPGHAYSILKIRYVEHPQRGKVKLIKLRNPWAEKEWRLIYESILRGDWSDDSTLWT